MLVDVSGSKRFRFGQARPPRWGMQQVAVRLQPDTADYYQVVLDFVGNMNETVVIVMCLVSSSNDVCVIM